MASLVSLIADQILEHEIDLMRVDAGVRQRVALLLLKLREELVERISGEDVAELRAMSLTSARLRALLAGVNKGIDSSIASIAGVVRDELLSVASVEAAFQRGMLRELLNVDVMSVVLSPQVLTSLVDDTLLLGLKLSEWWNTQGASIKQSFLQQMRLGIMQGETTGSLISRIRGRWVGRYVVVDGKRIGVYANGVLQAPNRQIEALVRTAVHGVANDARLSTYKANEGVMKGYQALATLDNRTSELCMFRSGMRWNLDGSPMDKNTTIKFPGPPPWHFNCRSTLLPVMKTWEELAGEKGKAAAALADRLKTEGAQASMDGPVSAKLTYETWLKSKPEAFQKQVLGPGRWSLWKENKLSFSQMIDQSGNPMTIAEMKRKYNIED